jgi:hypothetical protein
MPPSRIDILTSITGVEFEQAWSRRTVSEFDGISVPFIALGDLIADKRQTVRLSDLADCERLEEASGSSG